jgi:hypothetical protein
MFSRTTTAIKKFGYEKYAIFEENIEVFYRNNFFRFDI